MTQAQALDAIDRALAASHGKGSSREEQDIASVTVETLRGSGGSGGCSKLTERRITNGAEALRPWAGRCETLA